MAKFFGLKYILSLNNRQLLSILIGVIVGFAVSLLCMPFYDCSYRARFDLFKRFNPDFGQMSFESLLRLKKNMYFKSEQEKQEIKMLEQQHQKQIDEFEPRINLQGKPKSPQKPMRKIMRSRYAATELNMREKLFVGVLATSRRTLGDLTVQLNRSIALHANKLTFFVNNADMNEKRLKEITPSGVSVVNFNDNRDKLLPFHSFKYTFDYYINDYDWFFFVTDSTFVRANKVIFPTIYPAIKNFFITQEIF